MARTTVTVDDMQPGETVEVQVRRRIEEMPAGPGLAAAELVEAEGEAEGPWAEVVELGAARARRAG